MNGSNLSRRRFFIHSAHKTIGVSAGLAAWQACDRNLSAGADQRGRPVRVCLASGCALYKSDQSLAALQEYLSARTAIRCSRAFAKADDDLPGLENLERCDCLVLFTRRMTIGGESLDRIKRYCARGGAVVGIRTASHGLQNWLAMDKEVFGGDYQNHYTNETTEVSLAEAAKDHPVLAGIKPFVSRGTLYKNPRIAADTTTLLMGSCPEDRQPVAWTRLHNGGRVLYTSLGHEDDFREPNFLRLLGNAICWASGSENG